MGEARVHKSHAHKTRKLFGDEYGRLDTLHSCVESGRMRVASMVGSEYASVLNLPKSLLATLPKGTAPGPTAQSSGKEMQRAPHLNGRPQAMTLDVAVSKQTAKSRNARIRRQNIQHLRPEWHAPWKLMRVISGHLGWVRCVTVEPDNQWFATGAGDRMIKIWDLASGTLKLSLTGHISTVRGLAVSSRHPYLFTCGEDKTVKCWDLEQNKVVRTYHGHLSGVYSLDIHPTLDVLVTAGRDAAVRVWDMRTRQNVHILTGHSGTVASVKCQEDDPQIVSGSMDSTVRLWDLAAGKCSGVLTHHKKSVRALALHPNEFTFASGSADNIKQWKCPEGQFMQNFEGQDAIVDSLAVNADNVLFSGADDGSMGFWDWHSGHRFQHLDDIVQPGSLDSEAGIFCSTFDQSGSRLIVGCADKTVKVYREDPEATEETHPLQWNPTLERQRY